MRRTDFYLTIFSFAVLFYFYYMHPQDERMRAVATRLRQRNLAATTANPSSFNKALDAIVM
jgi:hypothetical protein